MSKIWRIVIWTALAVFLLGLALMGVALFSGSGFKEISAHGDIARYMERASEYYAPVLAQLRSIF